MIRNIYSKYMIQHKRYKHSTTRKTKQLKNTKDTNTEQTNTKTKTKQPKIQIYRTILKKARTPASINVQIKNGLKIKNHPSKQQVIKKLGQKRE
jgi:hypothetical protein